MIHISLGDLCSKKGLSCLGSLFLSTVLCYYSLDKTKNRPQIILKIIKTEQLGMPQLKQCDFQDARCGISPANFVLMRH